MQVNNFFIDLALRLLFIDLHFFIATIQIGVIVQVCYTPQARLCNLYKIISLGVSTGHNGRSPMSWYPMASGIISMEARQTSLGSVHAGEVCITRNFTVYSLMQSCSWQG